jgi:cytochrome c oxidase assembly protein subunit 15
MKWHHRYVKLVTVFTVLLIAAGGMVTSTDSGLSVPDWPTTYGWNMFTFPLSKMVGGIRYEHSHRLIASTVGFLIMVLAAWLWRTEPRAWVRRLGYAALAAVVTQGILGGITVLWFLPKPISISHAGLAQLVFCLTATIALVTSRGWQTAYARGGTVLRDDRLLQQLAIVATVVIYAQIIAGATMRHNDAGLAIPDFPLSFGQIVPPHWDLRIALHFAHRVGALIVTLLVLGMTGRVFFHHRQRRELTRPSALLLVLLTVQIALGALTVLSGLDHIINSLHVVTGGLVLVTSLMLALRAHRGRFGAVDETSHSGPARTFLRQGFGGPPELHAKAVVTREAHG